MTAEHAQHGASAVAQLSTRGGIHPRLCVEGRARGGAFSVHVKQTMWVGDAAVGDAASKGGAARGPCRGPLSPCLTAALSRLSTQRRR